jgi:sterol desaturase/sphingolipid hydroxylase (fatty acid hydroxylase superfamily)
VWAITIGLVVAGAVLGSFVEYWWHRLAHKGYGRALRRIHLHHHRTGMPAGALVERIGYYVVTAPVAAAALAVGWLAGDVPAALWFCGGAFLWSLWAGYSHQVQHEHPGIAFWSPVPVHYLHHFGPVPKANYGLGTHLWDKAFGTYDTTGWGDRPRVGRPREYLSVRWVTMPPAPLEPVTDGAARPAEPAAVGD